MHLIKKKSGCSLFNQMHPYVYTCSSPIMIAVLMPLKLDRPSVITV